MFASLIQGPLVRVIPVGMLLLALQRTIFVELRVSGVIIQVLMAAAAAAGVAGGSENGAVVGFTFGVMYDLIEGTPLGSTAMAMTIAGIVGGLLALIAADPQWWLGAIFAGLGTAAGTAMVPVVRVFIGESTPFEGRLAFVVLVVGVAGMIMSPLLVPLARWCLRLKRPAWSVPAREAGADD